MIKKVKFLIVLILISGSTTFSQQRDSCKVLMKEISGFYKGKCKNGLANGKGTAKGDDTYIGNFKDGLPDGRGKYTYQNGNTYYGFWKNGLKHGQGRYKYFANGKEVVQKGFWKDGNYVGKTDPDILLSNKSIRNR